MKAYLTAFYLFAFTWAILPGFVKLDATSPVVWAIGWVVITFSGSLWMLAAELERRDK